MIAIILGSNLKEGRSSLLIQCQFSSFVPLPLISTIQSQCYGKIHISLGLAWTVKSFTGKNKNLGQMIDHIATIKWWKSLVVICKSSAGCFRRNEKVCKDFDGHWHRRINFMNISPKKNLLELSVPVWFIMFQGFKYRNCI